MICKVLKEIIIILLLILFSPFIALIKYENEKIHFRNEFILVAYVLAAIPTFIAFEIFFFIIHLIIMIPGFIFSRKYRELYRFLRMPFDY